MSVRGCHLIALGVATLAVGCASGEVTAPQSPAPDADRNAVAQALERSISDPVARSVRIEMNRNCFGPDPALTTATSRPADGASGGGAP
jgi:hypothetical protein